MVSMLPNSQLYDLSYKYDYSPLCNPQPVEEEKDTGSIYDVLKKDRNFSKTVALIDRADLKSYYKNLFPGRNELQYGITLFVTDNSKIPDVFSKSIDKMTAAVFIKSYTLSGVANINYLISNGSTVYKTNNNDNPILCNVKECKSCTNIRNIEIVINNVGRVVREIKTTNGTIIVLDNIAKIGYIN